ncbi:MAG: hypothetical protein DCC71_13545 [Proteobacteria bacterium]|nr:MAG: hypothetical protein DCC71_13545 [Pseudomonadota bacterium]
MRSGWRRWLGIAVVAVGAAFALLALATLLRGGSDAPPAPADVAAVPPASDALQPEPEPPPEPPEPRELRPPELLPPEPPPGFAAIDLEEVREALPDNLYWELAAPTKDPRLLGDREREKKRRNEQYGKVLSGTGTEDEIRDYYDYRNRMSADYVRFVDYVLERYPEKLGEQDLELLHVARRLHLARLQELPRRMQEAFDRKREQDAAREAWLADEEAFEAAAREAAEAEADAATAPPSDTP